MNKAFASRPTEKNGLEGAYASESLRVRRVISQSVIRNLYAGCQSLSGLEHDGGRWLAAKQIEGRPQQEVRVWRSNRTKRYGSPYLTHPQDVQDIGSCAVSNHGQRPGWITNSSGKETAWYRNVHFGNDVVVGG